MNLATAKQALSGSYRVLTIPSAEKMFSLFSKITPDIILLDIEMPEMDGFTAIAKLMANEYGIRKGNFGGISQTSIKSGNFNANIALVR